MKKLLILLLFFFIAQKGFSQDWILAKSTGEDKYYIKSSYISKNNNIIKVWGKQFSKSLKILMNEKETTVYNGYTLYLVEYNCSERTSKFISIVTYNSQGEAIQSIDWLKHEQTWVNVLPDSKGTFS